MFAREFTRTRTRSHLRFAVFAERIKTCLQAENAIVIKNVFYILHLTRTVLYELFNMAQIYIKFNLHVFKM